MSCGHRKLANLSTEACGHRSLGGLFVPEVPLACAENLILHSEDLRESPWWPNNADVVDAETIRATSNSGIVSIAQEFDPPLPGLGLYEIECLAKRHVIADPNNPPNLHFAFYWEKPFQDNPGFDIRYDFDAGIFFLGSQANDPEDEVIGIAATGGGVLSSATATPVADDWYRFRFLFYNTDLTYDYADAFNNFWIRHVNQTVLDPIIGQETKHREFVIRRFIASSHGYTKTDANRIAPEEACQLEAEPPKVFTLNPSDETSSSVVLNGELFDLGGYGGGSVFFQWHKSGEATYANETTPQALSATGNFSALLEGLEPFTIYRYRTVIDYNGKRLIGNSRGLATLQD